MTSSSAGNGQEHLVALVPGQGAAQRWRQGAEYADEGIADLLR
jgi:hypothetical protein